jgi:hypothetical protein
MPLSDRAYQPMAEEIYDWAIREGCQFLLREMRISGIIE